MAVFTPAGSSSVSIGSLPGTVTELRVDNVVVTLADTEYSYTFPALTKRFSLKSRNGGVLKLSYTAGETTTKFLTLRPGTVLSETDVALGGVTLYFRGSLASDVLEFLIGV